MIGSRHGFTNYLGETIYLVKESWDHIFEYHPEITLELIREALFDPDYVFISNINSNCELYFLMKKNFTKERYISVIVKIKPDGLWISTAMTKSKLRSWAEIYRRPGC